MKKNFFATLYLTVTFIGLNAQHDHSSHQMAKSPGKDTVAKTSVVADVAQKELSQLLLSYFNIKNALVAGDATSAASNAGEFLRTVNTIDYKILSENNLHILAKDAGKITETNDLSKQRLVFSSLSANMASIAKALKLTTQPVYLQYCPMKKASWLSAEKKIRNPYYGSVMLTCGEVTNTF